MLTSSIEELKTLNSTLRDEYMATHLLQSSLEEKLREAMNERNILLEQVIKLKAQDADKMNEENDMFLRWVYFIRRKNHFPPTNTSHIVKFMPITSLLNVLLCAYDIVT